MAKTENVGIMDLERASRVVQIGDKSVTMLAVSAEGIVRLLKAFPVIQTLMNGGLTESEFSMAAVLDGAPGLAAELIACGADKPGDVETIEHVKTLGLGTQLLLAEGVVDATLEGGMAPFVARLTRMLGGFGVSLPEVSASLTEEQGTT